ncbi:sensor histidine kinase [Chryseotalea sanaruensis]|nr:HAMP domain-containing sensor histidine kinase [Chryseotalea sanaruensis]
MFSFLQTIANTGIKNGISASERRGILLCNQINLILFGLGLFLSFFYWIYYPPNIIRYIIPAISGLSVFFILLNAFHYNTISRIGTSLFVPFATMSLSIYSKSLYYDQQIDLDYFTFRFIILGASILPAVLFSTREKANLIVCLLLNFTLLISHDFIHAAFGVGYPVKGIDLQTYNFANVVIGVTYFVLLGSVLFLKINLERGDRKNLRLLDEVQKSNEILIFKNNEIEAQHQELLAQSEKLAFNQEKLLAANRVIEEQKELLSSHNKDLQSELVEKNQDLSEANAELIKYNNELRQFSYTISHNLRGPLASLLGLVSLFDKKILDGENLTIANHILDSAQRLDGIVKDLNKIIDIRNDIFKIRQQISLEDELLIIQNVLKKELNPDQIIMDISIDSCPHVYSVRPMVHSILYNLISNALKYRAPERKALINVKASQNNDYYILSVEDNGLGIDLEKHQDSLFKLYKRFHYHTEGKGIGLYLVKLQCEALGGYIEVASELNRFTQFTIYLRKPENIERQLLFDEPHAKIFFDASINATGIIWKGPITSEQYRDVFVKSLGFVKAFNTPNYIADISEQGTITEEDQQWMFKGVIPEAIQFGLRRIASVKPDVNHELIRKYLEGINSSLEKQGAEYRMFESMDEATNWMRESNELELSQKK